MMSAKLMLFVMGVCCVIASFGCGDGGEGGRASSDDDLIKTEVVPARWASGAGQDVATLTGQSEFVFIGTVARKLGQREEALGQAGDAAGSRGSFPISRFEVMPEQALAGRGPADGAVVIEQAGGEVERSDGTVIRLRLEGDSPIVVGQRYLFFASTKENGTLSVPPFGRLPIEGDEITAPEGWGGLGAVEQLVGLRTSAAAAKVRSDAR